MQGHEAGLSPAEFRRLVGALALLGSDRPGERDAAAHAASRIVQGRGLAWDELLRPPSLAPPQPEPRTSIAADLELAARHRHRLEPWPQQFVGNLLAHPSRRLSPRQVAKLAEIADALRSRGLI